MNLGLLGKAQMAAAKVAGMLTRGTFGMARIACVIPGTIKQKTVETAELTGPTLKVGRLRLAMERWKKKKSAVFAKAGRTIFDLAERETKGIEREDDLEYLFSEGAKCEGAMQNIREQITEIEKGIEKKTDYHEAILHLNSKLVDVRFAAVQILGRLGGKKSIPVLVKKLQDPDSRVRRQAAEFLHEMIDRISFQRERCR